MLDNFSLEWFISIPGILISAGVLLLLTALIIFLATMKKEKKNNIKEEENLVNMTTIPEAIDIPVVPNEIVLPVETNVLVEESVNDNIIETAETLQPEKETILEPIIEDKIDSNIESIPEAKPIISIYGGVNPANVNVKEEEHKPIYGGFNPLEATQTIPVINKEMLNNNYENIKNTETPKDEAIIMDPIIEKEELKKEEVEEQQEEIEILDF